MDPKVDNIYTDEAMSLQMVSEPYLARSVGPTREDACARKEGGL